MSSQETPFTNALFNLTGAHPTDMSTLGLDILSVPRDQQTPLIERAASQISDWPFRHPTTTHSAGELLKLAAGIRRIKASPKSDDELRNFKLMAVMYCRNELGINEPGTPADMRWSPIDPTTAIQELCQFFDTHIRRLAGRSAAPDRSLPYYVSKTPNTRLGDTDLLLSINRDPQSLGMMSRAITLLDPGNNVLGHAQTYTWSPLHSRDMANDWDSVDTALYQCFGLFWDRTGLKQAIRTLSGHASTVVPCVYIDSIVTTEHAAGKGLGLQLIEAAIAAYAQSDAFVFAVLHPKCKEGKVTDALRIKLEAYAAPLGFTRISGGAYVQHTNATNRICANANSLIQPL